MNVCCRHVQSDDDRTQDDDNLTSESGGFTDGFAASWRIAALERQVTSCMSQCSVLQGR